MARRFPADEGSPPLVLRCTSGPGAIPPPGNIFGVGPDLSRPDRGRRKWQGEKAAEQQRVYENRRRVRGTRSNGYRNYAANWAKEASLICMKPVA
jgi:hypothetical protein